MPRREGIDTSRFQHPPYQSAPVNWQQVRDAGVWWVAIQAIKGESPDPSFAYNRAEIAKYAIPYDAPAGTPGFRYRLLYGYPTTTQSPNQPSGLPWDEQARRFLAVIGTLNNGEGVMCDAEIEGITEALTLTWCQTVEASTKRPAAVYTGGYVAGGTIWKSTAIFNGHRPRVFAAYSSEADARNKHSQGLAWDTWQYSGSGACPGVLGACDLDQVDDPLAFVAACYSNVVTAAKRGIIIWQDIRFLNAFNMNGPTHMDGYLMGGLGALRVEGHHYMRGLHNQTLAGLCRKIFHVEGANDLDVITKAQAGGFLAPNGNYENDRKWLEASGGNGTVW